MYEMKINNLLVDLDFFSLCHKETPPRMVLSRGYVPGAYVLELQCILVFFRSVFLCFGNKSPKRETMVTKLINSLLTQY